MADELSFSFAFKFDKANVDKFEEAFLAMVQTIAGSVAIRNTISVGTSEEAIALGEVTAAKAFIAIFNRDPTNYVEYRSATGAANDHVYIPPKCGVMFFMGSDVTAPFLIANTAACTVNYWIIPD